MDFACNTHKHRMSDEYLRTLARIAQLNGARDQFGCKHTHTNTETERANWLSRRATSTKSRRTRIRPTASDLMMVASVLLLSLLCSQFGGKVRASNVVRLELSYAFNEPAME